MDSGSSGCSNRLKLKPLLHEPDGCGCRYVGPPGRTEKEEVSTSIHPYLPLDTFALCVEDSPDPYLSTYLSGTGQWHWDDMSSSPARVAACVIRDIRHTDSGPSAIHPSIHPCIVYEFGLHLLESPPCPPFAS